MKKEFRQPISQSFNNAVLYITEQLFPNGYDVSMTDAPDTYTKLIKHVDDSRNESIKAALNGEIDDSVIEGRFCIYGGASDKTIFGTGNDHVNIAFRAWHDYHHYHGKHRFTKEGERAVCELQKQDLHKYFGNDAQALWFILLDIEVNGQVGNYYETGGKFVEDQYDFMVEELTKRGLFLQGVNMSSPKPAMK